MMNVLKRRRARGQTVDLQEFMLFPLGAPTFSEALRWGAEVFQQLKKLLATRAMRRRSATRVALRPT